MSLSKRAAINITSGAFGYIIPIALNIISIPILISQLGNEAYGLLNLVNVIIGYLIVSDMGLDIPITKYVAEFKAKNEIEMLRKLISSSLQIYLRIGTAGMLIIILLANPFATYVFKVPPSHLNEAITIFRIAGIGFFFSILNTLSKAILNGFQRYEISNGLNVLQNLLSVSIGLAFVLNGASIVVFVAIRILFFLFTFIISMYFINKQAGSLSQIFRIHQDIWQLLKKQFGFGIILRLSSMIFTRIDQTLIGIWIGVAAVGVYAIPLLVASSVSALISSITHFIFPRTAELLATNNMSEFKAFFKRNMRFVTIMAILCYFPLYIVAKQLLTLWVGEKIAVEANYTLILLCVAFFINAVLTIVLNACMVGLGKLNKFTNYTVVRGAFMLVGSLVFIKTLGILGAAVSMLISCIVDLFFYTYVTKRYFGIRPFNTLLHSVIKLTVPAIILMLPFVYFLNGHSLTWPALILICILYNILYLSLLYFGKLLDEDEMVKLTQTLSKMLSAVKAKS